MPADALPMPPPAHDAPLPPARAAGGGVRLLSGVPYAALPGARPLELDLWLPPSAAETAPVVVFLHGGGWRLGSRHTVGPAYAGAELTPFEQVARAGIAVASVDYRLSGESRWPAQLHDVKAAVRWLRSRAPDLDLDPNRIAAWGESAGGHLAALLGVTADRADLDGELGVTGPSTRIAGAVCWYAPTDLREFAADAGTDPGDPTTREALLIGGSLSDRAAEAAEASATTHVTEGAPPFLLLHGAHDRFVPIAQSKRLHRTLTSVGADVELVVYDNADHLWLGSAEAAQQALSLTIATLRRWLLTPA